LVDHYYYYIQSVGILLISLKNSKNSLQSWELLFGLVEQYYLFLFIVKIIVLEILKKIRGKKILNCI